MHQKQEWVFGKSSSWKNTEIDSLRFAVWLEHNVVKYEKYRY